MLISEGVGGYKDADEEGISHCRGCLRLPDLPSCRAGRNTPRATRSAPERVSSEGRSSKKAIAATVANSGPIPRGS
ncbi:MAG: hypothetical protein JOZ19_08265 [Rubrobacter sp.]|nr:hypothetical protein [Rubrobacter sp.]